MMTTEAMRPAILIIALILIFVPTATAFAAANVITIDGQAAEIPEGMGEIREADDRTFVPLRFVSEYLKYEVWFTDAAKTAGVASDSRIVLVQDGNPDLFVIDKLSGETTVYPMDTAAFIEPAEGRMYLPIRFLAEAMSYTVGWDEVTQTVSLNR